MCVCGLVFLSESVYEYALVPPFKSNSNEVPKCVTAITTKVRIATTTIIATTTKIITTTSKSTNYIFDKRFLSCPQGIRRILLPVAIGKLSLDE